MANTFDDLQIGSPWTTCGPSALALSAAVIDVDTGSDGYDGQDPEGTNPQWPTIPSHATAAATAAVNGNRSGLDATRRRTSDHFRMRSIPTQGTPPGDPTRRHPRLQFGDNSARISEP